MTVGTDPVERGLRAAYARERLEEVIRAIAEDALSPSQSDMLPWNDESLFEADLRAAVADVTAATTALLVRRLTDVMDSAPPTLVGRLAAAPRFADHA
jgi:KaiC/GvpD/RAD55 family RecA-like ATPase